MQKISKTLQKCKVKPEKCKPDEWQRVFFSFTV